MPGHKFKPHSNSCKFGDLCVGPRELIAVLSIQFEHIPILASPQELHMCKMVCIATHLLSRSYFYVSCFFSVF